MKNNLLGKIFLSCSLYLFSFRKYLSYGLPIINLCNPGVHYETPCILLLLPILTHYHALSLASLCYWYGPARYSVRQYTTARVSFCPPHRVLCCYLIDFLCWEVRWLCIYVSKGETPVRYRQTDRHCKTSRK